MGPREFGPGFLFVSQEVELCVIEIQPNHGGQWPLFFHWPCRYPSTFRATLHMSQDRDYEVVRVQKKVFKGRPKTPPESCSVVTDPRVYCDAICDRAPQPNATSMEFLFMRVLTHDKIRRNQWL